MSIAWTVNTHLEENSEAFSKGLKEGLHLITKHFTYVITSFEYGSKHMYDELESMEWLLSKLQEQADALDISLLDARRFEQVLHKMKNDVYSLQQERLHED